MKARMKNQRKKDLWFRDILVQRRLEIWKDWGREVKQPLRRESKYCFHEWFRMNMDREREIGDNIFSEHPYPQITRC